MRSILPSGRRGAGLAASAAEMSGVPPVGIDSGPLLSLHLQTHTQQRDRDDKQSFHDTLLRVNLDSPAAAFTGLRTDWA